jgi:hypothetical protein
MYIKNRLNNNEIKAFGSYQALCLVESLVLQNRLLFIYSPLAAIKMKRALILIFTLTITNVFSQDIEFVIGKIYEDTMFLRDFSNKEIADTFYINRMSEIESLIRTKHFKIFPDNIIKGKILEINQNYDTGPGTTDFKKIITWTFNRKGELNPLLDTSKGNFVDSASIQELIKFVENPLNFSWGECGTFVPFYIILLQDHNNNIISAISIACGFTQIDLYPYDPRIKTGGLNEQSMKELYTLIKRNKN